MRANIKKEVQEATLLISEVAEITASYEDIEVNQDPWKESDTLQLTISECTPLHDAICNGKFETVKLLIELGANVNQPIKHTFSQLVVVPHCGHGIMGFITKINPKNIANNWKFIEIEKLIEINKGLSHQDAEEFQEGLT